MRTWQWRVSIVMSFGLGAIFGARVAQGRPPSPPPGAVQSSAPVAVPASSLGVVPANSLESRVAALEAWKASAGVFKQNAAANWLFAPESGDIILESRRGSISTRAVTGVNIRSDGPIKMKGRDVYTEADDSMMTKASGPMSVSSGVSLTLNNGHSRFSDGGTTLLVPP